MNAKDEINHLFTRSNGITTAALRYRAAAAFLLAASLLLAGASATWEPAFAQAMNPAEVAGAIQANAKSLKLFNYQQRMQLQVKGETKKTTLNQMNYDMNGNLQKTLLSEDPPPGASQPTGGRLKQRIVAKKTEEFKDMMDDIAALVKSYTEIPHDQLQSALKNAAFSQGQGDMQGSVQILMQGVNQPGDSLTIWIDRNAMLFRRIAIATNYKGDPVTATANYAMLPTGQVYMGQAIVNYPAKQVVVQIDNLNYQQSQ